MRAVSAALVLLAGVILVAAATAGSSPDARSSFTAAWGAIIGVFGFVGWLIAFVRDRDRP